MEAISRTVSLQRLKREKRILRLWRVCIFLVVLAAEIIGAYWIIYKGGAVMGDAISRTANAYYVLFLEPHKLASIGFVWNPLPSLVQLLFVPFAKFWQPMASSGFAGYIATSLFASANASLLFGYFKKAGCKTSLSLLFVALYAFNPFIYYYGFNGMSETFFFTAMIVCIANFALWMDQRRTGQLVAIGLMLAVGFLTRYETFALMLAVGLSMLIVVYCMPDRKSPFQKKPGKMKWDYSVATGTVLFLPVLYTVAMWMFLNWSIMGDPLYFLRSAYSNESQSSVALFSGFKELVANPFYALSYVLVRMIPFIPPFLVITGERIATKRLIKPDYLVFLMFIGGLAGFHYVMLMAGKSFGWLRFYCFALVTAVAWMPYELTQLQGKIKKTTTIFLTLALLLSAGIMPIYFRTPDLAREEYQTLYGGDLNRIHEQTILAEKINEKYSESTVLVDAFMTSSMILHIEHPENLVTNIADNLFDLAVADPHDQMMDYVVVPANKVYTVGSLDAINVAHPTLYESGASWADLVYNVLDFKLYKVIQWDKDTADLLAEVNENYSDAILLFDNSTTGMLHKNLKAPRNAITLTSENFDAAVENPMEYGVEYIIVPNVPVDASGSRDDILARYPELMDTGTDWTELVYENELYNVYKVLYPEGWIKEEVYVAAPSERGTGTTQRRALARFLNNTSGRSLLLIDAEQESALPGLLKHPESMFTSASVGFEDAVLDTQKYQIRYMILPEVDGPGTLDWIDGLLPSLYKNGPEHSKLVFENQFYRVYELYEEGEVPPDDGEASSAVSTPVASAEVTNASSAVPVPTAAATSSAPTVATPTVKATEAATAMPASVDAPVDASVSAEASERAAVSSFLAAAQTATETPLVTITSTATIKPTSAQTPAAIASTLPTETTGAAVIATAALRPTVTSTFSPESTASVRPTTTAKVAVTIKPAAVTSTNVMESTASTATVQPTITSAATKIAIRPSMLVKPTVSPAVLPRQTAVIKIITPSEPATTNTPRPTATARAAVVLATAATTVWPVLTPTATTTPRFISTIKPVATNTALPNGKVTSHIIVPTATIRPSQSPLQAATPKPTLAPTQKPIPEASHVATSAVLTRTTSLPTATAKPTEIINATTASVSSTSGTKEPHKPVVTTTPTAKPTDVPTQTPKPTAMPSANITARPTQSPRPTATASPTDMIVSSVSAESLPSAMTSIQATLKPGYIGWIAIQAHDSANVRKEGTAESEVVHIVRDGDWYPVLSISENGWFEIRISKDISGYVSPKVSSRLYRNR